MTLRNLVAFSVLVSGCATLAPPEDRQFHYVENVNATKAFGDAKAAIKVQNSDAGQIIAKGNYTCNIFRQAGESGASRAGVPGVP